MERRKDYAPPAHWQDFEDLCLKLWRPRLIEPVKHGRAGQPQAGVDIFGRDPKTEGWVGIQCKQKGQWPRQVLAVRQIEDEIRQAENFEPPLSHFIVATTARRDAEAQAHVRKLSGERQKAGQFTVDLYAWDDLQDLLHEQPQWPAADREPMVAIAKLPITGETFVGREAELAQLDAAWDEPATNVISFVAMGGAGKSALVNNWLGRLQADGWRGAECVLGWSFYSQRTEAAGASSGAFSEYALRRLGYDGAPIESSWEKGTELARLIRERRTLLVLDGLEPLQHPPGVEAGRLKDPGIQALVKELVARNPGLCIISTRLPVADITGRIGHLAVNLERLPSAAGAELLRELEVAGSNRELMRASDEFGGHGLALALLGTYLRDVCDGDVRRRNEVPLLDELIEQGGHARRVMESYERWLGEGSELQMLRLIGLFDRPAEAEAVEALRRKPTIPGLTDDLAEGDERRWRQALVRLSQARLLVPPDSAGSLDAHPLVREYFGERLRSEQPEAWRAGHERLYEHYEQATEDLPETLETMLPLYAAVVHGCRGGRVQEAAELFQRRIRRDTDAFSIKKLGVSGIELTAFASFFDRPWDKPNPLLAPEAQTWIMAETGSLLRGLGRLLEAIRPLEIALDRYRSTDHWHFAAITANSLSDLRLTLGKVAAAVHDGQVSVELADQSRDEFSRVVNRTVLADALHQAGRRKESAIAFREAETILAEWRPQYPRLHSVGGHRLCDLLLAMAEPVDGSQLDEILDKPDYSLRYQEACEEVQGRATYALKLSEEFTGHGMGLLDIALDQLSLGRALLGLALVSAREFTEAREHLNRAVEGLRHSGYEDQLPRGLLARAAFRRLRAAHSGEGVFATDADAALADLREAEEIARRGHMRLHEVDVHLEWTRLSLQTDDNENARRHLDQAHELVTATGYRRRKRELAYLTGLWRRSEERRPAVLVAASLESERIAGLQPPIDFVIITALEEEREALLRQLPSPRRLPPSEDDIRVYFGAQLPVTFSDGSSGAYSVIVLNLLNMGRVEAATATGDAIRRWRPRYVLLVGIAGGVAGQDVALGDVLISDQVVDYELQKITEDGPKVRYSVHRADPRLVGSAQNYRPTDWHERVAAFRPTEGRPRRVIGPIATGDKIVAVGEVLARYRNHWPKLIGVEMEAGGAASACFQAGRAPGFFMVRAASDLADAEKDTAGTRRWRTYACEVAAAYAIALLQSGPVVLGGSR